MDVIDDKNPYRTMAAPQCASDIEATRMAGQPMTVQFALTGDDYAAFNLHWNRTSDVMRRRWRRAWVLLAGMALVPALIALAEMKNNPGIAVPMGFVAIAMLIWMGAIAASRRRVASRSIHRLFRGMTGRAVVGPRTLTISPEDIETEMDVANSTHKWIAIEAVHADAHHAFLYLGSAAAIIVPKRAFQSETHFKVFVNTARQFQRQAAEAEAQRNTSAKWTGEATAETPRR
jgi:hypothetical protein